MPAGEPLWPALLEAAERALVQDVAPELNGDAKYRVLMAASAIRMSVRELRQGVALGRAQDKIADVAGASSEARVDVAHVVAAVRRGECDGHVGFYQALRYAAIVAASISNPAALTSVERDLAGVDADGGSDP